VIGKQTKGRGFRGTLNYVLGKEGAEIIGGNMLGQDARELSSEFAASRELKPNLSRVVYHASLSLPPGENLSDDRWGEVADRYMEGMGFDGAQYVAVKHTDTNHSHIHIVASRIKMDGSVVSESHDYRRSETHIRGLETEFGLTPTAPSREAASRAPTSGELQKGLREQQPSTKLKLQNVIGQVARGRPTMSDFISSLEGKNVQVIPNIAKTGHISGISFRLDGELMKGSDLGRSFTWVGLQKRGIMYDKDRDFQRIGQAIAANAADVRYRPSDGAASAGRSGERKAVIGHSQTISGINGIADTASISSDRRDSKRGASSDGRGSESTARDRISRSNSGREKRGDPSQVHRDHSRPVDLKLDPNSEHILRLAVSLIGEGTGRKSMGNVQHSGLAKAESVGAEAHKSGLRFIEQALKPIDDERERELKERQEERKKRDLERRKSLGRQRGPDLGR
jgi:hypothetical protein